MTSIDSLISNPLVMKRVLNKIFLFEDTINTLVGSDIHLLYIQIKDIVSKMKFTKKEKDIICLWMQGYNSCQIAGMLGRDIHNIQRDLRRISRRVANEVSRCGTDT